MNDEYDVVVKIRKYDPDMPGVGVSNHVRCSGEVLSNKALRSILLDRMAKTAIEKIATETPPDFEGNE